MLCVTTFVIVHFNNFGSLLHFIDHFINYPDGVIVLVIKYCPDIFYFFSQKLIGWTYLKCSSDICSECGPFPAVWFKWVPIQMINIRICLLSINCCFYKMIVSYWQSIQKRNFSVFLFKVFRINLMEYFFTKHV